MFRLITRIVSALWIVKFINGSRLSGEKFQRQLRDETHDCTPGFLEERSRSRSIVRLFLKQLLFPLSPWNKLVINFCELLDSRRAATGVRATEALSFPVLVVALLSAIAMDSRCRYFLLLFVIPYERLFSLHESTSNYSEISRATYVQSTIETQSIKLKGHRFFNRSFHGINEDQLEK